MSAPPEVSGALDVVGAAVGALPRPLALLIYLSATGSSARHAADVLGVDLAELSKLRMQISRAFAPHMKRRAHEQPCTSPEKPNAPV